MQVDDADRCFDVVGNEVPNITGRLQLRFNGTSHPETVMKDFSRALRRDRGFAFEVVKGRLRLQHVTPGEKREQVVSMQDTEAWIRRPAPGSDGARSLSEFASPRKLEIEISLPEGPTYRLPLFLTESR